MPTLQDVAKLAGVSTATVSRTLNKPELVNLATRLKVAAAIKESGYTRNETARSLATRSSKTIGILTDTFASNYFAALLDGSAKLLRQYGYYVLVEASGHVGTGNENITDNQINAWRSLVNRQVESIIVLAYMKSTDLAKMTKEHPNSIVVGTSIDSFQAQCVTFDHYAGGRLAAEHLLEHGHRDIAMVTGPALKQDSMQRGQGFLDKLQEHGIQLGENHIFNGDYTVQGGVDAMREIVASEQKYTAVFAQNDDMASGVAIECYNIGIAVPKDLSIIGFDNSYIASTMSPPLTTVSQPLVLMSRAAATLALNISRGRADQKPLSHPQTHFFPKLIERKSIADVRS